MIVLGISDWGLAGSDESPIPVFLVSFADGEEAWTAITDLFDVSPNGDSVYNAELLKYTRCDEDARTAVLAYFASQANV